MLLGVGVFFWRVLLTPSQFYQGDTHALLYPMKELLAREFSLGRWPLWDPHSLCGYPLLGSYISGAFAPQNLLYFVLPFGVAFKLLIVGKHMLGAIFQYALLRTWGIGRVASAAGGVAFALSGPLLSISAYVSFAFECIPLLVFVTWRVAESVDQRGRATLSRWLAAVAAFAFVFLQGDLQTAYTGAAIAVLAPMFAARRSWRTKLHAAGSNLAAGCVTLALVGVQLLPSAAVLADSDRTHLGDERFAHSLSIGQLAEFIDPRGLGERAFATDFIACKYLGASVVILAAIGLLLACRRGAGKRRRAALLLVLGAGAFVLALGRNVPLVGALSEWIPGMSLFRYPQKWIELLSFAVAGMAALGIASIARGNWIRAAGLLIVVTLDLGFGLSPFLSARLVDGNAYGEASQLDVASVVPSFDPSQRILRFPSDGAIGGFRELPDADPKHDRSARIAWNQSTLLGNSASRSGLRRVSGITSFRYDVVEALWESAAESGRVGRLADLFAAEWLLSSEVELEDPRVRAIGLVTKRARRWTIPTTHGDVVLVERETALPRVHVTTEIEGVPDRTAAIQRLLDASFDPKAAVVVLDADAAELRGEGTVKGSARPAAGRASVAVESPTEVVVDVKGNRGGGFLLLSDTFDRGWRVSVNDEPVRMVRGNLYARCVAVPDGDSVVRFTYAPGSFRWGLALSALAIVGLAVGIALRVRRP